MVDEIKANEFGDDGAKWATAFVKQFPDCGIDVGTMICWFCNAIEIAHDVRVTRRR